MADHNRSRAAGGSGNGQPSRRGGRKRQLNEDNLTEEEKARKQKNRDAAKKCRQKKIDEAIKLKSQNDKFEHQNRELAKKKSDLESKINALIAILQDHKNHGCQLPNRVNEILGDEESQHSNHQPLVFLEESQTILKHSQGSSGIIGPLSTRHGNGNNIVYPTSKTPTGLFSGAQVQIRTDKTRKVVREDASQINQEGSLPLAGSQISSQPGSKMSVVLSSPGNQFEAWNEDAGDSQLRSSPVQRVPNIDQMHYSPSTPKMSSADASSDEDYPPIGLPSSLFNQKTDQILQTASLLVCPNENVQIPCNNMNNSIDLQSQVNYNFSNGSSKFLQKENLSAAQSHDAITAANNFRLRNAPTSTTQSMQATAELISQAIQHIRPSEISETLQEQIVRCTSRTDSSSSSVVEMERDYLIPPSDISDNVTKTGLEMRLEPQSLGIMSQSQEILPQTDISEPKISLPVSISSIFSNSNTGTIISDNSAPTGYTVASYENYPLVTIQVPVTHGTVPNYSVIQPQQEAQNDPCIVQAIQQSQIPTTVYSTDNEVEVQEEVRNESIPLIMSNEIPELHSISSSNDYSSLVVDLPSLSFSDLRNQAGDIFEKKPSRLKENFPK